jgi:hypothetical protein
MLYYRYQVYRTVQYYRCKVALYDTESQDRDVDELKPIPASIFNMWRDPYEIVADIEKYDWPREAVLELADMMGGERRAKEEGAHIDAERRAREAIERNPIRRLSVALQVTEGQIRALYGDLNGKDIEALAVAMESLPTPDLTPSDTMADFLEAEKELNDRLAGLLSARRA